MKLVDAPGKINTGRPMSPVGIVVHHTASNRNANPDNVVAMCVRGVNKVPGPLYNYLIKRDGTIVKLTADNVKANHAGRGMGDVLARMKADRPIKGNATAPGKITANGSLIGVSFINDGLGEDIPQEQMDAAVTLCAYLCLTNGFSPFTRVAGHKEWSSRKVDPLFDMSEFRAMVAHEANIAKPEIKLPKEPEDGLVPFPGVLKKGSRSAAVKFVQERIGATPDGIFGGRTKARLVAWQKSNGLVPDGICGPRTWAAMQIQRNDIVQPAFY